MDVQVAQLEARSHTSMPEDQEILKGIHRTSACLCFRVEATAADSGEFVASPVQNKIGLVQLTLQGFHVHQQNKVAALGLMVLWGHWSLVTLFTVSTFWSKKDRVTSDQVCLESHTCHTKMVRPVCGRLWPYSCPKYHFWRKSRRKASFLSFAASFLKEVSQKSFVLELRSFIFEGSFAEKLGFLIWKLQFWMKSRRKASF